MNSENYVQGILPFPEFGLDPTMFHEAPQAPTQTNEELREENRQLKVEVGDLKRENRSLQNMANAYADFVNSPNLFPIGTIAKAFGRSAIWLNRYLEKKRVQFKRVKGKGRFKREQWFLYAPYDSCGYTGVGLFPYAIDGNGKDVIRAHTYWTVKGMLFIRELLLKDGLLT